MPTDLGRLHPAYSAMVSRWEMAWDFWRGGKFVLAPDHPIARYSFRVPGATASGQDTPAEPERAKSRWEWTPESPWKSYLWPHKTESQNDYDRRCASAYHDPLFSPLINDVVASILRTPPMRDGGGEDWEEWWADVDGCGTPVGAFINQAVALAFVFGRQHVICDLPRVLRPAVSQAEQRARGERPYWDAVPPTRLRNWRVDARGNYVWIVVAEDPPDGREPGDEWSSRDEWLRVWTASEWILYKAPPRTGGARVASANDAAAAGWQGVEDGTNPFGAVPLADLFVARGANRRNMACESPFASQLDLDRHLFNEVSEMWESDRTQSFSLLAIPETEGASGSPIDIGPADAFGYPAGAGAPAYVSPDGSLNTNRWTRHREKKQEARASAGIGRGSAEGSKEQRSAEAIVEEMRGQLSQMAAWAGSIQEFDRRIHRLAARGMGRDEKTAPRASYMRSFYRMAVLSAANAINQILASKVVSSKAAAIMVTPVVQAFLADFGVEAKLVKEATDSIAEEAAKPPPAPTTPPPADDERGDVLPFPKGAA